MMTGCKCSPSRIVATGGQHEKDCPERTLTGALRRMGAQVLLCGVKHLEVTIDWAAYKRLCKENDLPVAGIAGIVEIRTGINTRMIVRPSE